MSDKLRSASFKRELLRKLFAYPPALFLFLAGITDLAALWALQLESGLGMFAGVAFVLVSAGWLLSRMVLSRDKLAREALAEIEQEVRQTHERKLDDLERRLRADGDPRTEKLLHDLREMTRAFHESRSRSSALLTSTTIDILSGVEQLFSGSVESLEKTLQLWHTAKRIRTATARESILGQRERIIAEVTASIQQLGKLLTDIECLGMGSTTEVSDLARVRRELDESLEVAKKVQTRMQSFLESDLADAGRPQRDAADRE